jgi:hypothetical protein
MGWKCSHGNSNYWNFYANCADSGQIRRLTPSQLCITQTTLNFYPIKRHLLNNFLHRDFISFILISHLQTVSVPRINLVQFCFISRYNLSCTNHIHRRRCSGRLGCQGNSIARNLVLRENANILVLRAGHDITRNLVLRENANRRNKKVLAHDTRFAHNSPNQDFY